MESILQIYLAIKGGIPADNLRNLKNFCSKLFMKLTTLFFQKEEGIQI